MPELVIANSVFFGTLLLAAALIMLGMFLSGFEAGDGKMVMVTMSHIFRWLGVGLLMATFFIFLGSPLGPATSAWIGTALGLLGLAMLIIADFFVKVGDFKPVAWLFGALAVILGAYAAMTPYALPAAAFPNLGRDFFILLIVLAVAALFGFYGIRLKPGWPWKVSGYLFMLGGAGALYITLRYLFASLGVGTF